MLKNMTEVLVEQKLDSMLTSGNYHGCTCQQCREDIMAFTLNHLPAHYVSTDVGALYSKANHYATGADFDILKELARAMQVVERSPRHN